MRGRMGGGFGGVSRTAPGAAAPPALPEFSPDIGFDDATKWPTRAASDVNTTTPSAARFGDGATTTTRIANTSGCPSTPTNGTYRLTWPAPTNVTGSFSLIRLIFGGTSVLSFAYTFDMPTFFAGGTVDIPIASRTGRAFGLDVRSLGGHTLDLASFSITGPL